MLSTFGLVLLLVPLDDLERGYYELESFLGSDEENPSKAALVLKHIGINYIFGKKYSFATFNVPSYSSKY